MKAREVETAVIKPKIVESQHNSYIKKLAIVVQVEDGKCYQVDMDAAKCNCVLDLLGQLFNGKILVSDKELPITLDTTP
jgi:hypothetical protein